MDKRGFVVGIDEVGRGSIAGPVCVCAFLLPHSTRRLLSQIKVPLRDSKKLTKLQREAWSKILHGWKNEGKCDFAMTYVSASAIDKKGLTNSINLALKKSLEKLSLQKTSRIVLDGGLYAPKEFTHQLTIIKGDEKEPSISCASIVAKVARDSKMRLLAKRVTQYGFESHVGYGTRRHYRELKVHGPSIHHRMSFLSKFLAK